MTTAAARPAFVVRADAASAPTGPGIVHAVTGMLVEHGGNIVESQQFGDLAEGRFFMRVRFAVDPDARLDDAARARSPRSPSASRWPGSCGRPPRRTAR